MPTTTQTPLSNFEDYEKKYGDLGAVKSFEDYEKKYAEKSNVEKTDADSTNVGFGEKALNTLEALGHSATNLPTYAKGYLANVVEGTRPLDETNSLDAWAQEAQALSRKESESPEAAKPTLLGTKAIGKARSRAFRFQRAQWLGLSAEALL